MERINNLKKDLIEAYLDYYIEQHEQDIEELEHSYTIYNTEMKKLYGENYWDFMIVPKSLKNTFFIKDKFIFDNIYLINEFYSDNTSASYNNWKIVKMNNEILMIKLID